MDTIFIKGIHVHARHGCLPEEKSLGQRFIIHLEMDLDLSAAGNSDNLKDSVNYAEAYAIVHRIATERHFNLIEALAQAITKELFATFPSIAALSVTVEKPSAPIDGIFDTAGITLCRSRNGHA